MEFLWQEGHTAHATHEESEAEAKLILGIYRRFMEEWIAMPVVTGQKTESEKFAGALRTYACEAMMQDNKALQASTSHDLGQNFARAFDLTFQTESGTTDHAWSTSWGASTRLIGGLVMTHGDDLGLQIPPRVAPIHAAIVPIYKTNEQRSQVLEAAGRIRSELGGRTSPIEVAVDSREGMTPGAKYFDWELRGVPLRIELGPRDLEKGQAVLVRRDTREKRPVSLADLGTAATELLVAIQGRMLSVARDRREANSVRGPITFERFREIMDGEGAFVYAGWCGSPACEAAIKEETKAGIRLLPDPEFRSPEAPKVCLKCGKAAASEAVWARAY
jgi:prolyl-tRNA synthetase